MHFSNQFTTLIDNVLNFCDIVQEGEAFPTLVVADGDMPGVIRYVVCWVLALDFSFEFLDSCCFFYYTPMNLVQCFHWIHPIHCNISWTELFDCGKTKLGITRTDSE